MAWSALCAGYLLPQIPRFKNSKKRTPTAMQNSKACSQKTDPKFEGTVEVVGAEKRRLLVRLTPKQIHFPKKSASQTPNPNIIYTLSNELDADIMASTVRLLHTDHPIQIDEYHFNTRTQRQLLRKVPKDALVSGTITLPEGLQVQIPDQVSMRQHKVIVQKKNKLFHTAPFL